MTFSTTEDLQQALQQAATALEEWLSQQDPAFFNTVFQQGKWSTAGHVYHLIKTTKAITVGMQLPKMALSLRFGKMNRPERSYEETRDKYHEVLAPTNLKAPKAYAAEPGRIFDKESLISRFKNEMEDLATGYNVWSEKDQKTYVLPHPAIGKLSIREMGIFNVLHTYHHLDILKKDYGGQKL